MVAALSIITITIIITIIIITIIHRQATISDIIS